MVDFHDDLGTLKSGLRRAAGFTLVEFMISSALGLVIVAGVLALFIANRATYRQQEAWGQLQENARVVFELMSRDGRLAGFMGCASAQPFSALNATSDYTLAFSSGAIADGVNASGVTWSPALPSGYPTIYKGTDTLNFRMALADSLVRITTHDISSATMTIDGGSGLHDGDIALAYTQSCGRAAIFQVVSTSADDPGSTSSGSDTVVHDTSAGSPGNATKCLVYSTAASCPATGNFTDGWIGRLLTVSYYIAAGSTGRPSLYRREGSDTPMELIRNVDDLQVLYGVRESGSDYAARYMTAAAVASGDRWSDVVSLRVALTLESVDDHIVDTAQSYTLDGVASSDHRLRRTFSSTIAIRNRLP